MEVNTKLSAENCRKMVDRVDSIERAEIAEEWLKKNEVLTESEREGLMTSLGLKFCNLYHAMCKVQNPTMFCESGKAGGNGYVGYEQEREAD